MWRASPSTSSSTSVRFECIQARKCIFKVLLLLLCVTEKELLMMCKWAGTANDVSVPLARSTRRSSSGNELILRLVSLCSRRRPSDLVRRGSTKSKENGKKHWCLESSHLGCEILTAVKYASFQLTLGARKLMTDPEKLACYSPTSEK